MKFSMPRLVTAMAVRAIDAEELARVAHDEGLPVSAATIRKAMKGHPVTMTSATRIASVLRTVPVMPEMSEVIGDDPARSQRSEGHSLGATARQQRRPSQDLPAWRPALEPKVVARALVDRGLVDWDEIARIIASAAVRLARAERGDHKASPL